MCSATQAASAGRFGAFGLGRLAPGEVHPLGRRHRGQDLGEGLGGRDRQHAVAQVPGRRRQLRLGQHPRVAAEAREGRAEVGFLLAGEALEDGDEPVLVVRLLGLGERVGEDADGGADEGVLEAQVADEGLFRQRVARHVAAKTVADHGLPGGTVALAQPAAEAAARDDGHDWPQTQASAWRQRRA